VFKWWLKIHAFGYSKLYLLIGIIFLNQAIILTLH
jgi:hypothetical protein